MLRKMKAYLRMYALFAAVCAPLGATLAYVLGAGVLDAALFAFGIAIMASGVAGQLVGEGDGMCGRYANDLWRRLLWNLTAQFLLWFIGLSIMKYALECWGIAI